MTDVTFLGRFVAPARKFAADPGSWIQEEMPSERNRRPGAPWAKMMVLPWLFHTATLTL